jgi:hypothetical protein
VLFCCPSESNFYAGLAVASRGGDTYWYKMKKRAPAAIIILQRGASKEIPVVGMLGK